MNQSHLILEEHSCSICLTLFRNPVRIQRCKHTFCRACLEGTEVASGQLKCPLCRGQYQAYHVRSDDLLQEQIRLLYSDKLYPGKSVTQQVRLLVGNTTKNLILYQGNNYEWQLFVKEADIERPLKELANKVEIQLHKTFHPNTFTFDPRNSKVLLKRYGWGTFRIQGKITWNEQFEEKTSSFHHDLRFDGKSENVLTFILHRKSPQDDQCYQEELQWI